MSRTIDKSELALFLMAMLGAVGCSAETAVVIPSAQPSTVYTAPAAAAGDPVASSLPTLGPVRGFVTGATGRSTTVDALCADGAGRIMLSTDQRKCTAGLLWTPGEGNAWVYVPTERRIYRLSLVQWQQADVGGSGLSSAQLAGTVCQGNDRSSEGITFTPISSGGPVNPSDLTVASMVDKCH